MPGAAAAAEPERDRRPLTGPDERRAIALIYRDGDTELCGELYHPAVRKARQAILVVHEADGIGGNVRRHCQMLADLGYIALAADMHGRGGPLRDDEIAPALRLFLEDRERLRRRVRAGLEALKTSTGLMDEEVAVIGYCFGGTAALELARSGSKVAAVASFHGLLTQGEAEQTATIRARVLVCTGARDPLVPDKDVAAFQREMAAAGADWQLAVFGRALHSFTNRDVDRLGDPRMAYDDDAEQMSWDLLTLFLQQSFRPRAGVPVP